MGAYVISLGRGPQAIRVDKPLTSVTQGQRHAFLDLRLPSQPQSITAPCPVPNNTAWLHRHTCAKTCPRLLSKSGTAGTRTSDLLSRKFNASSTAQRHSQSRHLLCQILYFSAHFRSYTLQTGVSIIHVVNFTAVCWLTRAYRQPCIFGNTTPPNGVGCSAADSLLI